MEENEAHAFPLLDERLNMLKLLNRLLEEARAQGDDTLWLEFYCHHNPQLRVSGTGTNVAKELGIGGTEAIGLLRDLGGDRLPRLQTDEYGFGAGAGIAGVTLTQRGLEAIRSLPDPREDLLRRLDAIAEAIEGLQDVTPEEKRSAVVAVQELKTFVRGLPPGTLWRPGRGCSARSSGAGSRGVAEAVRGRSPALPVETGFCRYSYSPRPRRESAWCGSPAPASMPGRASSSPAGTASRRSSRRTASTGCWYRKSAATRRGR